MVSDELVGKALEMVARGGGNYEYFFARLNSPDWIEPLKRRGQFAHPPAAIVEATSIRFPKWPEGDYLIRMAAIAPEAVFGAIDSEIYKSDNQYVHETLLQIATELPVELATKVALAEAQWSSEQRSFYHSYESKVVPPILKIGRASCRERV